MTGLAPTTRRAQAAAAKRAALLATAREMFNAHPYADVTMRVLARAAGVSTGNLFTYWSDKWGLYVEAVGHPPITPEQGRALLALAVAGGQGGQAWQVVNG